jgi:hypothetical protein
MFIVGQQHFLVIRPAFPPTYFSVLSWTPFCFQRVAALFPVAADSLEEYYFEFLPDEDGPAYSADSFFRS